ncbi:MAG: S41 family peptidase [Candidatus Colwellbacteria bacterium]|nr:S41 family peptidase [Candidatus Colwellbacteria bacterium]MCK9497770.1 S41 family peptidase [Candidatus Colwellbacteria bacterium]
MLECKMPMMVDKKKLIRFVAAVLLGVVLVGASYYGGYKTGYSKTKTIEIKGVTDIEPGSEVSADFGVFWQAWSKIKENYLRNSELKEEDMMYGAIQGLAENIGDPYTTFFSPLDAQKFEEDINGEFGGIGAELEERNGQVFVVAPLKDTPAERAGLKPRDIIIKAGDTELFGKSAQDAVKAIRGEPGTKIKLVVTREGVEGSIDIEITREVITVPVVEWEWQDDRIAYVRIVSFSQTAPYAFYNAMREIAAEGPKAMILDLRFNPGGYLEVAVNIAGWFVDRGDIVVKERYASGEDTVFRSYGNALFKNLPVAVLVNGGTASASEILAGALRDNNGSKLVGEQTFGKGTVQTLEELKDGSMLKITVANWVTPNDFIIEGDGLDPDVEIELTEEDTEDVQLKKAIELLQ